MASSEGKWAHHRGLPSGMGVVAMASMVMGTGGEGPGWELGWVEGCGSGSSSSVWGGPAGGLWALSRRRVGGRLSQPRGKALRQCLTWTVHGCVLRRPGSSGTAAAQTPHARTRHPCGQRPGQLWLRAPSVCPPQVGHMWWRRRVRRGLARGGGGGGALAWFWGCGMGAGGGSTACRPVLSRAAPSCPALSPLVPPDLSRPVPLCSASAPL